MTPDDDLASLVAVLRADPRSWGRGLAAARRPGEVDELLDSELGLLAGVARARAADEIAGWRRRGIEIIAPWDESYPRTLRGYRSAPPLLFLHGRLIHADLVSVAVVGARAPSEQGIRVARDIARRLVAGGLVVVSGLAAGIDREAHAATLAAGGRTIAVIGNGLDHTYPRENEALQRRLARESAVLSGFWPELGPTRRTFPLRNGMMAALTLATVIVEAGPTSGTRIQARAALDCGRQVVLLSSVLEQPWARELSERPGVTVVETPSEVGEVLTGRAASTPACC